MDENDAIQLHDSHGKEPTNEDLMELKQQMAASEEEDKSRTQEVYKEGVS